MNYKSVKLEDLENISIEIVNSILISTNKNSKDSFVIYLEGNMGAGKTTLAQYIGKALGISEHMQSPTFTLMREYKLDSEKVNYQKLLHIDAYRFEDKKEGQVLNLNEYKKDNIVVIEWPNNMQAPDADMIIIIEKFDEETRDIKVKKFELSNLNLRKK